jgi:hypothetical protein
MYGKGIKRKTFIRAGCWMLENGDTLERSTTGLGFISVSVFPDGCFGACTTIRLAVQSHADGYISAVLDAFGSESGEFDRYSLFLVVTVV